MLWFCVVSYKLLYISSLSPYCCCGEILDDAERFSVVVHNGYLFSNHSVDNLDANGVVPLIKTYWISFISL